jgi:hypothetical protein
MAPEKVPPRDRHTTWYGREFVRDAAPADFGTGITRSTPSEATRERGDPAPHRAGTTDRRPVGSAWAHAPSVALLLHAVTPLDVVGSGVSG